MVDNNGAGYIPPDIKRNMVLPKEHNMSILGISQPVFASKQKDDDYEKAIHDHVQRINKQYDVLERDRSSLADEIADLIQKQEPVIYDGKRTKSWFNSINFARKQESVELFEAFNKQGGNFNVFDIETFGDTNDNILPYGISEVALNEYDQEGRLVKRTFNGVLQQDSNVTNRLQSTINKLKDDKYSFNTLTGWEKRSIVDLMRYSSYVETSDTNAFYYNTNKQEIKHNSIIKSVFNEADNLDESKVVRYMDDYLKYMQSGLDYISGNKVVSGINKPLNPTEAMGDVSKIFSEQGKFFLSFNGNSFDIPQLEQFANKLKVPFPKDVNHLDLLNVIRTVSTDPDKLKKMTNPNNFSQSPFGSFKLASFVHNIDSVTSNQDQAHNAQVDTDNTARVAVAYKDNIQTLIDEAETDVKKGFNYHPTEFSWSEAADLYHGQNLYSNGGVLSYANGDESFVATLDENGKLIPKSNAVNKTVISSRAFYQFAGQQDMGEGKLAFRFYNPEADEYSFVVRKGEHAFNELQDFVQSRFYNWDNAPEQVKRDIINDGVIDRARRRYDRFFSMDGGGWGLSYENGEVVERGTKGFSGLKRMVANAEKMKVYQDGKDDQYREKVKELRKQGMTEAEAKLLANPIREHQILDELNFNSILDKSTNTFVANKSEKEQFFKMYNRLIDELPYLNQAINQIDGAFAEDINSALLVVDDKERKKRLRLINQKRDQAVSYYQQLLYGQTGRPEKQVLLKPYENRRINWFNPEIDNYSSINFETVQSATNNINAFAKKGLEDGPQKAQIMKERLGFLVENLHSQGIINGDQRKDYFNAILNSSNTPYIVAQKMAGDMRDNSQGKFAEYRMEEVISENKRIKEVSSVANQEMINQSIEYTKNVSFDVNIDAIKGKKIISNPMLDNIFSELDKERLSGLQPNNQKALEELLSSIQKAGKNKHIAIVSDGDAADARLKVYAYNSENSVAVQNQLMRKKVPTQALEFTLPLINETGMHKIGNQTLNAHSYLVGKDIEKISSAQYISRGYADSMNYIMSKFNAGEIDRANDLTKRTLRNQIENMSGAQQNAKFIGANDTMQAAYNKSDSLKQGYVKTHNAFINDLFFNGFDGVTLKEHHFYDKENIYAKGSNGTQLRSDINLSDISLKKQYEITQLIPAWTKARADMDVYLSSIKSDAVEKGIVGLRDQRRMIPYGAFDDYGRDNAVQRENVYKINSEVDDRMKLISGVSRNNLLYTEDQKAYDNEQVRLKAKEGVEMPFGNDTRINMRMAYMTNDDFRTAIESLYNDDTKRHILDEAGLLHKDKTLNYAKLPRVYEQQFVLADDVKGALKVDKEKRYAKGKQFQLKKDLTLGSDINPGDELGIRIHDNGTKEVIKYEGTIPATMVSGHEPGRDIVLKWQEDPFKFFIDGEKGTDTVTTRDLLKAITGDENVVGIYNPDVAKHKDFAMVMAGEARLMAEKVGEEKNAKRQNKAIKIIEEGGIGLKWDAKNKAFIDRSFDLDIERTAFDNVFTKLQGIGLDVSAVTSKNVRIGVHEVGMANVSLDEKVVDETGHKVIREVDGKKKYGKIDGVQWGHREMSILNSYGGLDSTYKHIYKEMMQNTDVISDVDNLKQSLYYMKEPHSYLDALTTADFESLPIKHRNAATYSGTIFDNHNSIKNKFSGSNAVTDKGFWLELPSVEYEDGKTRGITIDTLGDSSNKQARNKLFIPFTHMDGANGDLHLRQLQKHISGIYNAAEKVNKAGSITEARDAHKQLQSAVDGYVKRSMFELTSSDGMLYGDGLKTKMKTSATGLTKLMDFETSNKHRERFGEGEYTIISENDAKNLGIYDDLANGKTLYSANIRYPSFHDGALAFTKVQMADWVKDGEQHITSFAAEIQNADSDGDKNHLTIIRDDDVQEEWKQAHDRTKAKFQNRWEDHNPYSEKNKGKEDPKPISLAETRYEGEPVDSTYIPKNKTTSENEISAKTGKKAVGSSSNLNLFMRAVADQYYPDNPEANYAIKETGRGFEQKNISSKHGAKPVAFELLESVMDEGNWERAIEIDNNYFDGMFQKKYSLKKTAKFLPMGLANIENGFKNKAFKIGTSTGVNGVGVNQFLDVMDGKSSIITPAHALELKRNGLDENALRYGNATPIERLTTMNLTEALDKGGQSVAAGRNKAMSLLGGVKDSIMTSFNRVQDSVKGMSTKNKLIAGGGIALGGIAGYNILNSEKPERHYIENEEEFQRQPTNQEPRPAMHIPGEEYSSQNNANITIKASGRGGDTQGIASSTQIAMSQSGMNHGNSRVTIHHNDNTQQLNRVWYRDKVQENM